MEFEIFEIIYHLSGILVALFFLLVTNLLRKEKQEVIKSRIFLKYDKFKTAFYIVSIGAIFFLIGSALGLYKHTTIHFLHELTEIIFNLSLAIFATILYFIIRIKKILPESLRKSSKKEGE